MVTKEQIAKIIRDETWVEVDSAVVYGVNDAAEKIMQAIEAAQQSVPPTGGTDPQIDPDSPSVNPAYRLPGEPAR